MEDTLLIIQACLILAAVVAIIITIFVCARRNKTKFDRFCRWWWNTSFKLAAYMPFCNWMTHLMLADSAEEKATKQNWNAKGQAAANATADALDYAVEQRKLAEEQQRREREARLRTEVERQYGTRDVRFSEDGTQVWVNGGRSMSPAELENMLNRNKR